MEILYGIYNVSDKLLENYLLYRQIYFMNKESTYEAINCYPNIGT